MKLNNKAFFMPTIMMFIFLFTFYLAFQTYESLNYMFLINSYEEEVYYEIGLLSAKSYIKEYLTYDDDFDDTCEQKNMSNKYSNVEVDVTPMCFVKLEPKKFKIASKIISNIFNLNNESLEISKNEYNELITRISKIQINESEVVDKVKKKVTKEVKEKLKKELLAAELSEPEIGIIIEAIKIKVKSLYTQYIAFDIQINLGEDFKNEFNILYIYNFEKPKNSTIRYT